MKSEIKYDPHLLPYKIEGSIVRCEGYPIKEADASTFKPLNSLWSVDDKHVFSGTQVLRGAHLGSFHVLNELFARHEKQIYYIGGVLRTADIESFTVLDAGYYLGDYGATFNGYAKDKNGIWFYSRTIGKPHLLKKADPASFEVLPYGYARDAKRVFSKGLLIAKADPASFRLISQRYTRDHNRIFYGNTAIEDVDCGSFEIVDPKKNQAKDKHRLYERHQQVDAYYSGS
ncbi:MAG TPA: DKNYY domain-containing protein [Verrucomicrobiae bacterium]|nr:DKNYY domain-containing protein [Verrucomicrobiae bacterium]